MPFLCCGGAPDTPAKKSAPAPLEHEWELQARLSPVRVASGAGELESPRGLYSATTPRAPAPAPAKAPMQSDGGAHQAATRAAAAAAVAAPAARAAPAAPVPQPPSSPAPVPHPPSSPAPAAAASSSGGGAEQTKQIKFPSKYIGQLVGPKGVTIRQL